MTKKNSLIPFYALCMIAISIALGAFGAHGLKPLLDSEKLTSYQTAVSYLMYHGLALIVLSMAQRVYSSLMLQTGIRLIMIGVIIFSCSIIALVIAPLWNLNLRFLGPITPIGGVILITAWFWTALAFLKYAKKKTI
jgi:uncharacterized membrane protein YgdD (TMEM256/DUF423 family)